MRKIAIIAGVLVSLVVVAMVVVPMFISAEGIFNQVSTQAEATTGRKLTLGGDTKLQVFPSLVVELNDVQFASDGKGTAESLARMEKLSLHVPWTSVFTGKVVVEHFVIDGLDLVLEKHQDGTGNWELSGGTATEQVVVEESTDKSTSKNGLQLPESFDINLGQIEVNGGSLTFHDHQMQTTEVIDQLGLELILPSLRKPLGIKGKVRYKLQTFTLDVELDNPIKAIEGRTFTTDLTVNSDLVTIGYNGEVAQNPMVVKGKLAVAGDSVKQIASWQDQPMQAKDNAFNQFSVSAAFTLNGNKFDMTELVAKLDELDIKGQTTVYLDAVPKIVAKVNLGDLNLNPYIPEAAAETPPPEDSDKTPTEKAPIIWDNTPIDLSALGSVNVDLTITSNSLQAKDIKLGTNKFTLHIQDSVLDLAMEEFNAYQGKGVSRIELNAEQNPYVLNTSFDLTGIDFEPLLTDAAGFDKVLGTGQFKWNLRTAGISQRDFVEALNGNVSFDIKDGAVRGANIAAIAESAKNIMTGNLSGVSLDQDFNNADQTDFASFAGSIQFNNGVGTTNDIALLNPLVRVTANGTIDLPGTLLDMRSSSKLVSSLEGQGGQVEESGITIPIKIVGPFHDVKVKPDISSGIKKKLEDKVKDKLKSLFGG